MDAPDSPSCQILQSMSLARYTIGIIKNVIKGCGVEVLDLKDGATFFLCDKGLSNNGRNDAVVGANFLTIDGITTTSGAPICFGLGGNEPAMKEFQRLVHQVLVGKPVGWDPAPMVRMMMTKKGSILDEGAANGDFESTVLSVKPTKSLRIGRNDFCPCGSSKKYKKCCSNNAPLSKNEDAA